MNRKNTRRTGIPAIYGFPHRPDQTKATCPCFGEQCLEVLRDYNQMIDQYFSLAKDYAEEIISHSGYSYRFGQIMDQYRLLINRHSLNIAEYLSKSKKKSRTTTGNDAYVEYGVNLHQLLNNNYSTMQQLHQISLLNK